MRDLVDEYYATGGEPNLAPPPNRRLEWRKDEFYGGVHYVADNGVHVSGYFRPHLHEHEGDCRYWCASNIRGPGIIHFRTAAEAMAAAEEAMK